VENDVKRFFFMGAVTGRWILAAAYAGALGLVVLNGWGIEETWIKPSLAPRAAGAAGRAQWGGMIPEFQDPPRIFLDNDPYYFMRYAQRVARGETLRVRETDLDNVPYGREVHWNSGWVWWLAAGGVVASALGGGTVDQGVEVWGLYAEPALFLLVLGVAGWWVARRRGTGAAAALVFLLACLPAVMWDYGYGRPDHHGMHNTAALVLLLGLVLSGGGWVAKVEEAEEEEAGMSGKKPKGRERKALRATREEARRAVVGTAQRAIVAAALGAAAGLWVGATQQIFVLAGAGLGLLGGMFSSTGGKREVLEPGLFRVWGSVAGGVALGLYLLEYAPWHFGMRLEVNHPLYAAAMWGAGEVLAAVAAWRGTGKLPAGAARWWLAAAAVALVVPPLALVAGPDGWHAWRDGAMRRQHGFINEFEPFLNSLRNSGPLVVLGRFGFLPLLVPVAGWLACSRRVAASLRAGLLVTLGAVLATGAMMMVQVRWAGLLSISMACMAMAVLGAAAAWLEGRRGARWIPAAGYAVVVAPLMFFFAEGFSNNLKRMASGVMDPVLAWTIASRDLAFNLKRLAQLGPVRVMSGPGQTPALHFFGGVHGTASLYWENTQGVREAAEFFADQGDAVARRIAAERGITHVVLQEDTSLAESSVKIALDSEDKELIKNSLAYRLCDPLGNLPEWLEPVPYYGSPMAAGFQMRVYKVRGDKLNPAQ